MTDDLKAPERIGLIADGLGKFALAHREETDAAVHYVRADHIATLEAALADMTQQRDAAMAGAVRVKPLVWVKHPSVDIWRADTTFGTYKVFGLGPTQSWDFDSFSDLNDKTSKSAESVTAAKAAAQADYNARILSALTPDPDRMLALTAAAEAQAEARGWNNAMLTAITHVAEIRNAHTPGPIFKALNEAMGKIDDARFAGLRRYQTDATEAAAKGGV